MHTEKRTTLLLLFSFITIALTSGNILHVGQGQKYTILSQAVKDVAPGDTILIHRGVYEEGMKVYAGLSGTPDKHITIKAFADDTVIFRGGASAFQLRAVSYLNIQGLIFEKQTGNGLNVDDNGIFDNPSHHVHIEACIFRDIDASGNNDLLKMSGVDDFEIINCTFLNGSKGGSGIDMVGCHKGIIQGCRFENMGSNAVQAKGGTQYIRIERNFFKDCGHRTLNLGGSTGLAFFRPQDATFEAADLQVYSNIIVGSMAAVAYVGSQRVEVVNNTIIDPEKWVIRILQETVEPQNRFVKCNNNTFVNNIVYKGDNVSVDCSIGGNTDPESFSFSTNMWYNHDNPQRTVATGIPVHEKNPIVGKDPLFVSPADHNYSIQPHSPATATGTSVDNPALDFLGKQFLPSRAIGAVQPQ